MMWILSYGPTVGTMRTYNIDGGQTFFGAAKGLPMVRYGTHGRHFTVSISSINGPSMSTRQNGDT